MALSGKVAFNTAVQVASKVIGTVVSLAAVALITRYLGSFGFGHYTTAITFVTFFSIAGDFGLTLVTTQLLSKPGVDQRKILNNVFTFRLLSAAAVLILAPITVIFFPYDPIVKQGVIIASLTFFSILLNQVFVSLFQKELRADRLAISEVLSRFLILGLTIVAVWYDWGMSGVLWAMAAGNIGNIILNYYFARRFVKIGFDFDWELWRDILKRSWPLMVTIVLNLVYLKTDVLLLSLYKSPIDVGFYGAAYKVIDVLVTIPFMLGGTVLPILAMRWQAGEKEDYRRAWQKIFDASSLLAWPAVAGGLMLATPIMVIVAGEEFAAAGPILRILIFAVAGVFFGSLFSHTMISFGKQRRLIGSYIFTALSSLILYLILIPKFSYIGAAWVTVYSEVAITLCAWYLVRQESGLRAQFTVSVKSIVAAAIMALVLYFNPLSTQTALGITASVILGALVYVLCLFLLKTFSWKELRDLIHP